MVLRNLWRRKTRTLLTMLGIAIGVAAVVAFSAFGEGWATGFEKTMSTADADLTVGQKDAVMLMLSTVEAQVGDEIKQISGVAQISGVVIGFLSMPESPYFIVIGQDPRGFAVKHYRIVEGQSLSLRRQMIIGKTTAKNFKKSIGENFRINDVPYRVVGIYETGVSFEDGGAVIGLADAQRAFEKNQKVSYLAIKLEDIRRVDEIKDEIETRWPELTATRSGETTTQSDTLGLFRSFGWFLGIFAVIVGGLGMMNTTLMSVFERTREIGVLRAVGWRRRRVVGMILGESVTLALLGGILGILLGIGLTRATSLLPAVETLLSGILTPTIYLQAIATALLLGTVGGIYPAWRAAQLSPVEAMRYEGGSGGELGPVTRWLAQHFGRSVLRNLWRRPTRTLVTVAGIGIGVAFIVALIAIADGFTALFTQLGSVGKVDLIAEEAKASDMSLSVIDEKVADRIEVRPEIKSVSKLILGFSSAPGIPYFVIWGLDPREEYIKHFSIREGRTLQADKEILLGRFAANGLKKTVGDSTSIAGASYRVVGIYENGAAYEDAGAVIALKEAQQVFHKPHQVSFLGIALKDPSRADEVVSSLSHDFPEITVDKTTTFAERTNDINTTRTAVNALVGLTLIVGGIVMMNAMLMSVFERTHEIGVLRALGWRRSRIIRMILLESLALSLLSSIVGILLGVGLAWSFTLEPTFGGFLLPVITPELLAEVFVFALLLGAVGGVYPAWRAAGLAPIEALRYE
jgi:ABC-type antimicrobial peptide transport system permease subunit